MVRVQTAPFDSALIVEEPHASLDDHLREIGITPHRLAKVPNEASLIDAINKAGAQVLFKRSRVPVTRRVVEACPALHAVQLCCIGSDSVDLTACADHGVLVFNDPISNGRSVVELAIGHLVALSRRLYETDVAMHADRWEKSEAGRYEVLGKTLGILGLGNIGRQVARAAEALGMRVQFFDNRPVAQEVGREMGYALAASLADLFRTSDLLTVHTSAKDAWDHDNAGLLDPVLALLGADRPDSSPRVFLNLARGNVHSSEALLDGGEVGRACGTPRSTCSPTSRALAKTDWKNPYAAEPRISCTPHIGASTLEAQPRIARRVATTIESVSRSSGALRDCVFEPAP
jgi:D-3-phosphoglycerate dehydrogenase